jgi:hypothetical protein
MVIKKGDGKNMGFKINVDRFGFAKKPEPEKVSRDYAAEYAKSLIDKEAINRINEDAVLLGKITAEESTRATAIEQLQGETDRKLTAESDARAQDKAELTERIDAESSSREADKTELEEKIDQKADMATRSGGFCGGGDSAALRGGAIGFRANAKNGGAVGQNAMTLSGFAGGFNAKTAIMKNETETAIDAIQLGTGTNTEEKSLQVYEFKLMNADGTVPEDRIPKLAEHDADIKALKASGGGSGDLSNYYTKDEIDFMYGDIDSALDGIIALQVAKGGDAVL